MRPPDRPPSIDSVVRHLRREHTAALTDLPHPLLVDAARAAVAAGDPASALARAESMGRRLLQPVINATGVLLHTNLGRAPVAVEVAERAVNLEFDLDTGTRGSRRDHAAALLARAAGAEAGLVVNNGAAALLLVLAATAAGRGVVVSRGELVEIGGGFRIPEVLAASGARLIEVGTTNRTHRADYEQAVADHDPALLLKVHASNYRIEGFTASVEVGELARLGPPVVADIGSGLLDANTPWLPSGPPAWLAGEPAARQTLAAGAGLITFSGDKLLGGPQAGIILGRSDLVEACARHPLARALRPGSLVLAALQTTALAYLDGDGRAIAFWRMASADLEGLRTRAAALGVGAVVELASVPGGGTTPGVTIASAGIAVDGDISAALRRTSPPVIARVEAGRTLLDLRTVDPADDEVVAAAVQAALVVR